MLSAFIEKTTHLIIPQQRCLHVVARPSSAPGLGVCEWSPEGLYDKSVSWIPNTDEILTLMK